VLVRWIAAKSI